MSQICELSKDMSFLIIDQSEAFRNLISTFLKFLGFTNIYQSITTSIGIDILSNKKIDFVICELDMSEINGIELLKEIRDSTEILSIAFLMISNNATREDIALLGEYEIDGFLKKPFSFHDLSQKIPSCVINSNDPNKIEFHFQEAKSLLKKGMLNLALNKYEWLLKNLPKSSRARVGLSKCNRLMKNYKRSIELCKEAIKSNSLFVQSFDEIAQSYMAINKIEIALDHFKQAFSLSPNNPIRYERVANLLMDSQRFKEAEEVIELAVNNGIFYPNIYDQFGKSLFYQKKLEKASLYFEKALLSDPNNRSLINLMGICLKDLNKHEEALKYYNNAIKAFPTDTKVLFNKALCFYDMQEFDKAKKLMEYILKLDPRNEKAIKKLEELSVLEVK